MPRFPRLLCVLFVAVIGLAVAALPGAAFETRAKAAFVKDVLTGTVLLEKDADRPLPPASMSKLMTLYMLFEALRDGRVTMDTEFTVSARAERIGGSTMFLNQRDRPTARELILGIIVNSGNDACVVVAEGLAGSEEAFARIATERAAALGLTQTTLRNSTGWPAEGHVMSMRDLAVLAQRLIEDFPQFYPFFLEREFDYKARSPANRFNRNPLLALNIGADGLKTGFTSEAGHGLAGSAVQGPRRVIFVISGLSGEQARAEESERIVNWAFRQFTLRTLSPAATRLAEAPVWLGDADTVGLVVARDLQVLVPALRQNEVVVRAEWQGPLQAPVQAGQPVGEVIVEIPDMPPLRVPLLAEADVGPAGVGRRLATAARVLVGRAVAAVAF